MPEFCMIFARKIFSCNLFFWREQMPFLSHFSSPAPITNFISSVISLIFQISHLHPHLVQFDVISSFSPSPILLSIAPSLTWNSKLACFTNHSALFLYPLDWFHGFLDLHYRFLPCDAMRSTVLVIVILSVRLSVCHTRALCPHGSTYDHDFFTIW